MKIIKNLIKKNYKVVIGIIIGGIISSVIAYADVTFKSSDVTYNNETSGLSSTNMQGAIDELYKKSKESYNRNIIEAYTADFEMLNGSLHETNKKSTNCYKNKTAGSCTPGTVIVYKVNPSDDRGASFNVLHDDGNTMTLIMNTVSFAGPCALDNNKSPIKLIEMAEIMSSDGVNFNEQEYSLGYNNFFGNNRYTGCDSYNNCTSNPYTILNRQSKTRIITLQEAVAVGCTDSEGSCPLWLVPEVNQSGGGYNVVGIGTSNVSSTGDDIYYLNFKNRNVSVASITDSGYYYRVKPVVVVSK